MGEVVRPSNSKSDECLLSVIIPAYNYAHLLRRVLGSVLDQTTSACEVIVVDDGSTDNTLNVLAELQYERQERFRFVTQANAGAAAARNHGWRLSRGNWLLFLDADDELMPGALNLVLNASQQNSQADLILAGHVVAFSDGRTKYHSPSSVSGSPFQRAQRYLLKKRFSVSHGACVYRRSVFQNRPYVETLRQCEDIPVFAYMLVVSSVVSIDQPTVIIHKHVASLRHSATCDEDSDRLVDAVFERLPQECQVLRGPYRTQRNLSVFRRLYLSREWQQAQSLYVRAFLANPWQALRWTYLSKFIRVMARRLVGG